MFLPAPCVRAFSLLLAGLLVVATFPTAVFAGPRNDALIGSVSAAGPVKLRGVAISREGTLFSGDTLATGADSWATVAFAGGQRIELGDETDLEIAADDPSDPNAQAPVRVAMRSGSLIFSSVGARAPVSIRVGEGEEVYEILAAPGAIGDVAFVEGNRLGVRAREGALTVRSPGQEPLRFEAGSSDILQMAAPPGPEPPRRQLRESEWLTIGIIATGGAIGYILWRVLRDETASNSTP